jgi:arginase
VEHAARQGRVVLLWADAHADLNTAETSPSGAFHGMVLRSMIDDGLVAAADVLMLGVRALDDAEAAFIAEAGIRQVAPDEVGAAVAERADAARAAGAEPVLYAHIDLDVLDPGLFAGVGYPTPFGLALDDVTGAIAAARGVLPLAGAGVTEFAPAGDEESLGDDLSVILRILGALTR